MSRRPIDQPSLRFGAIAGGLVGCALAFGLLAASGCSSDSTSSRSRSDGGTSQHRDASASGSDGGTVDLPDWCGHGGEVCCDNDRCRELFSCEENRCVPARGSEMGRSCSSQEPCTSGLCIAVSSSGDRSVCTLPCVGNGGCLAGWTCAALSGRTYQVCQCSLSTEHCDNQDNDCDGVIDNYEAVQADCRTNIGPGYQCVNGSCACPNVCQGQCVDTKSDSKNCGGCGHACDPDIKCQEGLCQCPLGTSDRCAAQCVDFATDINNCGTCGQSCLPGELCAGRCGHPDWAAWPMPNSPHTTLPNTQAYVVRAQVVKDIITGLWWQKEVPPESYSWEKAKAYCAELSLAEKSDWRLPTIIELQSLVDLDRPGPMIDSASFANTPSESFWSATLKAYQSDRAWGVNFADGSDAQPDERFRSYRVRCVRTQLENEVWAGPEQEQAR